MHDLMKDELQAAELSVVVRKCIEIGVSYIWLPRPLLRYIIVTK